MNFSCGFTIFVVYGHNNITNMKTKDKQDEAQRHEQRNYLIKEVRNQLVTEFNYSYTDADIFIGRIWDLSFTP